MTTKPILQRIPKEIIYMEQDEKQSQILEGWKEQNSRGIDEYTRTRKIASMVNSGNQENLKLNKTKSKEQLT
jgi:hypothetical protein